MRFLSLSHGGKLDEAQLPPAGELFFKVMAYRRAGPDAFVPCAVVDQLVPFSWLVQAVTDAIAVNDAAIMEEMKEEAAVA